MPRDQNLDRQGAPVKNALSRRLRAAYGAAGVSDGEARSLASLREVVRRYAEVRPAWYRLRLDGKDDEAKAYRAANTTPTGAALVKAIGAQIDLQNRTAAATHDDLSAGASRVRMVVLAVCALALALAAFLAVWIVRVLSAPVARATAVANSIAQGRLANDIPDDTGPMRQLLAALRDMQASLARTVASVRANAEKVAVAGTQIAQG